MKYEDFKEKKKSRKSNENYLTATCLMQMYRRNLMISLKNNRTR